MKRKRECSILAFCFLRQNSEQRTLFTTAFHERVAKGCREEYARNLWDIPVVKSSVIGYNMTRDKMLIKL